MNEVDVASSYSGTNMVSCIVGFFTHVSIMILSASLIGWGLHTILGYVGSLFS